MSDRIRVPVVPTGDANCVAVSLSYVKGTGVVLSATPMTVKDGMESFFLFSGRRILIETMARLNRKRIETLMSLTRNEIAMRTGRAWTLVAEVCEAKGLTLPPEEGETDTITADEWALLDGLAD